MSKSAFTPERAAKSIDLARKGRFKNFIAAEIRVHFNTFRNWFEQAERPDAPPAMAKWLLEFREAEALHVGEQQDKLISDDATAAQVNGIKFHLERLHPVQFGDADKALRTKKLKAEIAILKRAPSTDGTNVQLVFEPPDQDSLPVEADGASVGDLPKP
jgi:hypothetical protein